MTCVLTYSESERTGLELIAAAQALASKLNLKVVASWVGPNFPAALSGHGASEVVHLEGAGLEAFTAERYADALASACAELKPPSALQANPSSTMRVSGERLKAVPSWNVIPTRPLTPVSITLP